MTKLQSLCARLKEVERDLAGMKRGGLNITKPATYAMARAYRNNLINQIKNA